jgi:hypothetical protein
MKPGRKIVPASMVYLSSFLASPSWNMYSILKKDTMLHLEDLPVFANLDKISSSAFFFPVKYPMFLKISGML